MAVAPSVLNSIRISLIQTGCCESGFDSNYPVRLNGIITQDEFQQSIHNINQTIATRKLKVILYLVVLLCVLAAIALFAVGGVIAVQSRTSGFPLLVAIGLGIFGLGMIIFLIGSFYISFRRRTRMHQAIAKESIKYSMRSPTPCGWRLHVFRHTGGRIRHRRRVVVVYGLLIEIGNSGNRNVPHQFNQTASSVPQKNNIPPPLYTDQSTAQFCSKCGTPGQHFSAKFCRSCGQPFNS